MKRRRLLIFDLNGTILHRLTHHNELKSFKKHPVVMEKGLSTDITIHGSKIIFRPHTKTLLTHVFKHFDVAVWTSSRPKNAFPMVHHAFASLLDFEALLEQGKKYDLKLRDILLGPNDKAAQLTRDRLIDETKDKNRLQFLWTQLECDTIEPGVDLDTPATASSPFIKPLRKKNLDKVYSTFPQYTSQNTLIIDDTEEKLAEHSANHLHIPVFDVIDTDLDFTVDKTLLGLNAYLDHMLKEDPADIRDFLKNHQLEDYQ